MCRLADEEMVIKQWIHEYTASVDKVNEFYTMQLESLMARIEELKAAIKNREVPPCAHEYRTRAVS